MNVLYLVTKISDASINREYLAQLKGDVMRGYVPPDNIKLSIKIAREYLVENKDTLNKYDYIIVCDATYYQALYKACKTSTQIGYIQPSTLTSAKVTYIPSTSAIFFNPERSREQIKQGITAVINDAKGSYTEPGKNIIHSAVYPSSVEEIKSTLDMLLTMDKPLACDIETYSLKHPDAGLASICFCWDEHNGCAFKIDVDKTTKNEPVRELLRWFFENYKNTLLFHNISYDAYILTYQLYMKDLLDNEGMQKGLSILLNNFEDTMLITYLATNSCSGNHLSLKEQSLEFAGDYAQEEISDVSKIPINQLLEYNLTDGLATWFVYNKWYNRMVQDQQLDIYTNLFKPAIKDIINMQLNGLPVDMNQVRVVKQKLCEAKDTALGIISNSPIITEFTKVLNEKWVNVRNSKLKTKRVSIADAHEVFNPNSNLQLKELFYDYLQISVINLTKTKEPSTDSKTIKSIMNQHISTEIDLLCKALLDYADADKMLSTFIPAFENAYPAPDGWHYLYGSFHLGGTVSGRLSSSRINLQNLPATGATYAKLIKSIFKAPSGWLFCGLDFSSLTFRRAI